MGMTSAEKMRAARERARIAGLCTVCCQRKPAENRAVCAECNAQAYERVEAGRKKALTTGNSYGEPHSGPT